MERVVLAAKRYDFTDEKTGKRITGAKIMYLEGVESSDNVRGSLPVTVPAQIDLFQVFKQLPGVYKVDFSMFPDGSGKPVLRMVSASYVKPANFEILGAVSVPF